MRLVTISQGSGRPEAGMLVDGQVIGLEQIGYPDAISFLNGGEEALRTAERLAADRADGVPLDSVRLHAPVPNPGKFICIGLNYRDHAIESGMEIPEIPTVFTKYGNAVCGHGDPIILPSVSDKVDYEAELGFVVGKRAKGVRASDWEEYVFGYTCVHDVSARDYQLATSQWTIGKTFDTFGPFGPALVSKDEVPNVGNLRIWLDLNGERLQDSNTDQLVFDVPALLEYLSAVMTLEPGDIVSTGTPPGVGMARKPPIYLRPGDTCTVGIEGIGELVNPCIAEPG
ncbi:MAG: fumarylacetoacetate hydrolase family protein [Bryobacterales bacterium]|nr:fumarylacetoacetate hydrolase family protein [Bryobacterales bacterium]